MTIAQDIQAITEALEFYATGWDVDPQGPGETTLFGTEYDRGQRAARTREIVDRLAQSIEQLQRKLVQLQNEQKTQFTIINGIENPILLLVNFGIHY